MFKFLSRWFSIYKDEIGLFLWSTLLLFLIRSSNILFNNFAETAFLKRFGVEYLPIITMINSVSMFFIMGFLAGIMAKVQGSKILNRMLIIAGVSVLIFRFIIPLGFDIIYPVLYIMKAQYEVLLGLLFWNMANDLFNVRQSKRIFPLITAGGVIGGVIGSFGTPPLVRLISIDNLMVGYFVTTVLASFVVLRMRAIFPTLITDGKKKKKAKKRANIITEFKKVAPIIRESNLVKVLIIVTFIPNVMIPIMNYQFNYAIDATFATEGKMIEFFGYFRGVMNIVSFIILLFVGKIYGRWGLPIALMFHPFNYIIAFFAFLFRFDIFSAMYARLSTTVFRTTINTPARAVLVGLFPAAYRAIVAPFLRGTVVRVGTLLGSGLIMLLTAFFHPRYLSIVGIIFGSGWLITIFFLKKNYAGILLDLMSNNMLDLKSFEQNDVNSIFNDKKMQTQMIEGLLSSKGSTALWYAELLKSLSVEGLDGHILSIIRDQDEKTKKGLLQILSSEAGSEAIPVFEDLADPQKPGLTIEVLKAANQIPTQLSSYFLTKIYNEFEDPVIKAHALAGLYRQDEQKYERMIEEWLASGSVPEKRAGIIAAGSTASVEHVTKLEKILEEEEEHSAIALILEAFHELGVSKDKGNLSFYMVHSSDIVRKAALNAVEIEDDNGIRDVVPLLGDEMPEIRALAMENLKNSPYQSPMVLIESLAIPNHKIREGIFSLLESLEVKDVDVFRFAKAQIERAYNNLSESEALRKLDESIERDLLIDHLAQKVDERVETVLRVLATQDDSGQMRVIWRGLSSDDPRQKANGIEALEEVIGRSYSEILVPLIEGQSAAESLEIGKKVFQLTDFSTDPNGLFNKLLSKYDWVTLVLTLYLIGEKDLNNFDMEIVVGLTESANEYVRTMSRQLAKDINPDSLKGEEIGMEEQISIPDKILHLRSIQIFDGLSLGEMAAIASVTEEAVYEQGNDVIKEGDQGETMYMIISGAVAVIKGQEDGREIEIDKIDPGGYFGEMALFENEVRSATIRTTEESRLLVLHKREFTEIVRDYPQIALHICKELSHRLRKLHERIQGNSN